MNIAELLKDCPKGMELDCTTYDNLYFNCIREHPIYPITCWTVDSKGNKHDISFNWYGKSSNVDTAKCVIFPKGKTTWEGFVPPCKFKDGDIIYVKATFAWVAIYKESHREVLEKYAAISGDIYDCAANPLCYKEHITEIRHATEEEKHKLFDAIKADGYKWNAETKTLKLIVEKKFDITTLKPFESKVLVRSELNLWKPAIFGCYVEDAFSPYYTVGGISWKYCIPYEGNEHLLGKAGDCDDFYKTWKE